MNVVDKEIPLENATAPKTAIAVPDISGQDVAVTSEVVVDINVGDVNVLKLDLSEAKVKQSTHESVILRETTVGESEGEYIADLLPETKKAKPNIVEGHSTSVSSVVIIQDKESILLTPDKPKERLATPNITSQEIAEKTEIILGSSLELLKHETPTSAQATAEQLPYHSIIQSETSSNELEGPIQLPIKPESKIADISFEGIQAVSVYEVSTQDGTSQLAPESKPEDHFASAGILSRQVAQSTVIVPESSVGTIKLQTPAKVLASLEQIPFESILTSVVSTSEKESSFEKQLKLDFNRAEKAFEEEKSIFISEVTVEDKEGELAQFTRPKEVTALADISAQEVAEMSEVLTEYSVGEIPTFDKPAVKAQEEQLPFESIIQIETSVQESEGVYKSREAPLSSVADIGVVEEKGVIITEVTLEDKEDQYTSPLLPETRKAEPSFIPIELYQKAEVVAEDSFGEITVTAPEKTFAKSLQSTLHSVVLKQTTVGESEAPLEEFIKPFSKTAEANFESAKSGITVNEITVQEKESDLIGPIKPSESRAEKSLLTREIACKSEVTVESSVKEFEQERPSKVTASVNQTPLQSIVQLEVSLIESESEYQGLTKPETKTAGISFEEGQGVSIVEVVVGDLENTFLPGETPGAKSATVNVCGREVAVKTEVLTESSVSETPKEEFQPIKSVNVQQIPFESVITTKPIVNEKESVLYEFKSDAQMANIAFVEGKGISITQVLTEDKESQLQLPEIPKKQTATSDVLAHNIVEQSEVQSEYSLSEITKFDTKLVEATSEHTPLESIVTTIPTVVESEQVFQKHFKPETKVAHSVLEEKQSVNVILTTAGDKETQFTEVEKPKERIASPRVSELEVAEHTEQTLHQTVGEFEHQKPILSKASSQHTTFESVIQTETIVRESEGKFDTNLKPDKRKASMSYEVGQSVTISEITLGEAESDYIGQLKPKDNKAKMVLSDVQEVAKQSQIIPEDSVGALVENIMVKESAVSEQATHQSLTVLENLVEEKETEFSVLCKPDTKRAGVAIEKSLKVQATTEVIPEYKEGGLAPLDLPEERRATPDIVSREVAEVSETLSQISIGDVVSTKTKTTTAIRTQTPFTTSIQEQVIVQESEEQFVHTIAQTRRASLVFEEGKGVVITEITAEDNEMPYMCDIPKPQTAHPEISVKEVVETFEISPEMQPSEIIVEFPDEIVANVDQTHLTSLLQSEVDVRESEVEFKSVIFEKKTAEYTFEEGKGVSVTIVTSEDKEDSLKPLEKPALKQAVPGVISKESLQTSEVQAEQTVGELKHHKPKEAKAKKEHPVSESVIVIQNIPQEQEETMEGKPGAPTAKAQIDFTLMREVAEKSEVITGIHPKKLETTKPAESFAKAETIVMEGIIQSEVSVNELEEELIKPDLPAKRRASVIKDVQEGIKVAQTVVADKEGIHETQPLPKQVKPSSLISEQETIVQTEVLVSSSTSTLKKDKMPEAVKIKPGQIPFESLETSITTVQEQEENIEVSWKPAISKGVKSVQESQSISVTEIVTEEKLHSDITQEKIPKEVAETKFIDQEVAVKSEVIAQLPVTPFDVSVPTPTVAKQSTPTQHHLIVTTHDTGEVEDSLSAVVTPAAKNIPIDVEEHKTTLLVTHVHPEEVPGVMKETAKKPAHTPTAKLQETPLKMVLISTPDITTEIHKPEKVFTTDTFNTTTQDIPTLHLIKKSESDHYEKTTKFIRKFKDVKEKVPDYSQATSLLEEGIEPFPKLENVLPEKIEDMPEEVTVTDTVVITPEKKDRVKKAQKRVIKKKKDGKQEVSTEEEETILDRESLSSVKPEEEGVTFEEVIDMPTEKEYLPVKATVRDIPEVTTVETTTVVTKVGDKKRVSKKRVIKKVKDGKENIQLCEETPQEGEILDETTQPLPELEGLLPESIEDMPEEITVTDVVVITPETKDKIKRTQKRVVKKKKEGKQETSTEKKEMVVDIEVLKILKPYESEVIFEDVSDIPHETTDVLPMKVESSQLPELTEVETITTVKKEQGKRKVIRKKIVKKTKGGKEDIQYIDEKPVILEEGIEPFPELENVLPEKIEDMPEEVTVTDTVVITPEKKDRVKKAQKRVIKKKKDGKQEVSTEEEETILDRESLSSVKPEEEGVTFEEVIDMPTEKEYLPVKATVRDIPEVTTVETTTVVTKVGDKKRVSKKRVIKKVKDGKENIQLCEETPQEGEILDETTQPLPELEGLLPESIEDMPEEITVTDVVVITPETKDKIKRTQKRVVKKKKEGKQETSTEKKEMVVDIEVLKILKPYESEVIFEDVSDIPHETTDVLPMKVESSQLPELTEVENDHNCQKRTRQKER
ncbi:titin-like [Homalodisca vitripennis]|uniref:titin-like n=1 Tax=Homalodisca vitripennis TaxID=197043 RepID=UPI001EEC78F0|nr:titin-like [Homalodisca vitripennis]